MDKDLHYESNASLLSSLLNIPADELACQNMSDILEAPLSISIGSLTRATVHPREVFREALKYPCAAIILVHNHPSGYATPSSEDISFTENMIKAGNIIDIPILDHVIIANHRFISMKEYGYMDKPVTITLPDLPK